jgi:hypothetical protein
MRSRLGFGGLDEMMWVENAFDAEVMRDRDDCSCE